MKKRGVTRRRWNTGDINFGTDIIARGVAYAHSPLALQIFISRRRFPIRDARASLNILLSHFCFLFRNNDAAANSYRQLSRRGKKNDIK